MSELITLDLKSFHSLYYLLSNCLNRVIEERLSTELKIDIYFDPRIDIHKKLALIIKDSYEEDEK